MEGANCSVLADRLDPETVPMGVDERDYFFGRRSSSAPKKAAALLRISLARRNSRFSRSKATRRCLLVLGQQRLARAVGVLAFGFKHPTPKGLPLQTQLTRHSGITAVASPL